MLLIHLRSVISFAFYHQIVFVKKRLMAFFGLYLFFLSLLISYFVGGAYINKNLPGLLKSFPEVTFQNGVLTAPEHSVSVPIKNPAIQFIFDASKDAVPPAVSNDTLLLWVHGNQLLLSTGGRSQIQTFPPDFSFVTSQENLTKYQPMLLSSARLSLLFFSAFFILISLFLAFGMAFCVGILFKIIRGRKIPYAILARWAFFMLGPISLLWYLRLWINIPLFAFAQLILCVIYMQQIFNLLPEAPSHAH